MNSPVQLTEISFMHWAHAGLSFSFQERFFWWTVYWDMRLWIAIYLRHQNPYVFFSSYRTFTGQGITLLTLPLTTRRAFNSLCFTDRRVFSIRDKWKFLIPGRCKTTAVRQRNNLWRVVESSHLWLYLSNSPLKSQSQTSSGCLSRKTSTHPPTMPKLSYIIQYCSLWVAYANAFPQRIWSNVCAVIAHANTSGSFRNAIT